MFDIFSKLTKGRNQKSKGVSLSTYNPYSTQATMACFENGSYDNNYPNITKIAEQFAVTLPYAIDSNGEQLKVVPNAVSALYRPNAQMSSSRFFKTIAVMALVHPAVYLVVWHKGNKIREQDITGYTFLESPRIALENGRKVYYTNNGKRYTENEVITLSLDVNPYSVLAGYSPSLATKKYSTLDDCIADFQVAYFKNGAMPAGQMVITATNVDDFNDSVDYLQKHHKGSKANNNIVYTMKPVNDRGETMNAKVEWIPFSEGSNRNLSLQELFTQAEKRRDTTFGVPAEIKGIVSNSNYASVATASHIFQKYTVYPKLIQIWTDFTHELNRITGGLGYSITFDYDIAPLADEEKVKAETQLTQMNLINSAKMAGFELESVVEAFNLPDDLKKLEEKAQPAQDPEFETDTTPEANQVETSTKSVKSKAISDVAEVDPNLVKVIDQAMLDQIELTLRSLGLGNTPVFEFDPTQAIKQLDAKLSKEMFEELIQIMIKNGGAQYVDGRIMLTREGYQVLDSTSYNVSESIRKQYAEYLNGVAESFNSDTKASIDKVLERADFEGWDNQKLADEIRNVAPMDEWRVQRLARSETHRSLGLAGVDAMNQLQEETGVKIQKIWKVNPMTANHCGECLALDGQVIDVDTPFISAEDNNFADIESADAHPNCHCYLQFRIAPNQVIKSVDVTCPNCKRHLVTSKGGTIEGLKCQGCKKKWNFKIIKDSVSSEEIKKEEA